MEPWAVAHHEIYGDVSQVIYGVPSHVHVWADLIATLCLSMVDKVALGQTQKYPSCVQGLGVGAENVRSFLVDVTEEEEDEEDGGGEGDGEGPGYTDGYHYREIW